MTKMDKTNKSTKGKIEIKGGKLAKKGWKQEKQAKTCENKLNLAKLAKTGKMKTIGKKN